MIASIKRVYVVHYRDNGQVKAYVEWVDHKGKSGRTEGDATRIGDVHYQVGTHMGELFARAKREGAAPTLETW